jgi:hypothetical protein
MQWDVASKAITFSVCALYYLSLDIFEDYKVDRNIVSLCVSFEKNRNKISYIWLGMKVFELGLQESSKYQSLSSPF